MGENENQTSATEQQPATEPASNADLGTERGYVGVRVDERSDDEYTVAGAIKAAKAKAKKDAKS